jgi:hypothetical protein
MPIGGVVTRGRRRGRAGPRPGVSEDDCEEDHLQPDREGEVVRPGLVEALPSETRTYTDATTRFVTRFTRAGNVTDRTTIRIGIATSASAPVAQA